MVLWDAFVYVSGHCFVFWKYLRDVRKVNADFAPPHIKYKKRSQ
jgi:hypothetical protein